MAFKFPFAKDKKKKHGTLPSTQREREEQAADRLSRAEARHDPDSKLNIAMPYIWVALSVFLGLCLYTSGGGYLGGVVRFLLLSFFSYLAYALPPCIFLLGIGWRRSVAERALGRRLFLFSFALLLLLALLYTVTLPKEAIGGTLPKEEVMLEGGSYFSFDSPTAMRGGFLGALIGWVLYRLVGPVLTVLLTALAALLFGIFGFGFSPDAIVRGGIRVLRERAAARRRRREELHAERAAAVTAERRARGERAVQFAADEPVTPDMEEAEAAAASREGDKHRRFADLFAEAEVATEPTPSASREEDDSALRAFKEQKIRERLRSHEGIHTFAVSDLRPAEESTPKATAVWGEVAPTAPDDTEPFRGVEDFRRITVSEPVRIHPPAPRMVPEPPPTVAAPTVTSAVPAEELVPREQTYLREDAPARAAAVPRTAPSAPPKKPGEAYQYPPIGLLRIPTLNDEANMEEEIQRNADTLVKTLESFGIPITITGHTRGPRITRYEFVQKAGIRVDKVATYANDITQKLSTQGVRIEAPIPNKSSIGVEVPNHKSTLVRIRSLLDTDAFRNAESKTTIAVGCDVTGTPIFFDLAKAPHMLIAGATGMGKSVCINAILISLLYKASTEDVRLILIDPKKVEFNVYSKVPHLLIPVVTDPTKAAGALNWAVNEMEHRYDLIEAAGVRDIKSYNSYCKENGLPTLPKIIIVIDELNDLMMTARKMVEASICRIAQKARAAGIHLLIGTQRPSVNVITGDIKVNIPARIAFRVNQAVDSRTILDMQGAEKLLPNGDMLFSPTGTPQRVQGAFVEDEEVKAVVSFLSDAVGEAVFDDAILSDIEKETAKCAQKNGDDADEDEGGTVGLDGVLDDPKFEQALDVAFSTGSISTSLLQRRIGVGFGRAARFIDAMCEMGVVGENRGGSKARELLMSRAEYEERKRRVFDD